MVSTLMTSVAACLAQALQMRLTPSAHTVPAFMHNTCKRLLMLLLAQAVAPHHRTASAATTAVAHTLQSNKKAVSRMSHSLQIEWW